ncbi:hypothetical protein S58_37710 [Bradyrhizobium oligotrophicum S58]|uniref:Uncharacterized protein n=1 Tax=Bradyrhizobium oligotrophicum S58 TaxID=1245469 RepID=M4Z839_9BRAD|nr:hypothetical protein S58_37710 [Bradyrhizobium oligotrophicum S58]
MLPGFAAAGASELFCAGPRLAICACRATAAASGAVLFAIVVSVRVSVRAEVVPVADRARARHPAAGENGRGSWIRTNDLQYPKLPRYQAALYPDIFKRTDVLEAPSLHGRGLRSKTANRAG